MKFKNIEIIFDNKSKEDFLKYKNIIGIIKGHPKLHIF
ncbi:hypothetical protein SGLAD_v1c06420 [Spiroplasma gladiatoris]|uniref:Uncharacterized protein n=1 Tax=Spiroplasma gladiatoris TaxID=2143 RepID=A0A4P7AI47_9MOLU|nr:hypothetical protein SGLAD_v1c06420 [Spiroplasma gladiatoris]